MHEQQNIEAMADGAEDDAIRTPGDWVLVRRTPKGEETVVAKSVAAYDIDAKGQIFVSDGNAIVRVTEEGKREKVVSAKFAISFVPLG